MGAVAGDALVENAEVVRALGIPAHVVREVAAREFRELASREREYRGDRPKPNAAGRTVILVDDGLATGSTMLAAIAVLRRMGADGVIVAVPVCSPQAAGRIADEADEVVCLETPRYFSAVGEWYEDFSQVTDQQVKDILANSQPAETHSR
jgi:predicted phosphoribosyltransferase